MYFELSLNSVTNQTTKHYCFSYQWFGVWNYSSHVHETSITHNSCHYSAACNHVYMYMYVYFKGIPFKFVLFSKEILVCVCELSYQQN